MKTSWGRKFLIRDGLFARYQDNAIAVPNSIGSDPFIVWADASLAGKGELMVSRGDYFPSGTRRGTPLAASTVHALPGMTLTWRAGQLKTTCPEMARTVVLAFGS